MAESPTRKIAVWIVMILLFFGLIGFGATGLSGNVTSVAQVGALEIPAQSYARQLSRQLQQFEEQTGQSLTMQDARQFGIDQAVLNQMISTRALENEALQLGISVGDTAVAERIREVPQFQGIDGAFDREAYAYVIEQSGLTESSFETGLRQEIARSLLEASVATGVTVPDVYAATLADFIGEQRSFAWAVLTPEDLDIEVGTPDQDQLRAYYDANPDAFTRPETRGITFAWVTPEMIQDDVEIDETALRELYEDRIDEYMTPERRLAERLVFSDEDAARAAQAAIAAGEADFETLVAERGLDLADVDLGDVSEADLGLAGPDVFAAGPGDVVGPLPSPLGPALFRVNAVLAAQEVSFDEALPDLREELAGVRARRVIDETRSRIADLIAGGATIEDLADQTDMELGRIDYTAESQDGIAAYSAFRDAATAAQPGAFPELRELEDGGLFALRVDELREPALRPFDEVAESVAAAWRDARRQDLLLEEAERMAARLDDTGRFGLTMPAPNLEEGLTRRSFVQGTAPDFMEQVFEMEPGTARAIPTPDGAILVHVDAVTPATEDDPTVAAARESLARQATAAVSQDLLDVVAGAVRERTEVTIDQAAVNAVAASFQ